MRPERLPFRARGTAGPWHHLLHVEQGARPRLEDAWSIAAGVPFAGGTVDAFAVFDGLGGRPNGQQAAWAAAAALADALRDAADGAALLARLQAAVGPTGGATTAAILIIERGGAGQVVSIGDSSVYGSAPDGPPGLLHPHDRADRHMLTAWLGRRGAGGHLRPLEARPPYLLATDGVADEAGPQAIARLLAALEHDPERGMDALFADLRARGMPDNATALAVWPLDMDA